MNEQKFINEKMRAILIDWIVGIHEKFHLQIETLFLTTTIIDRYLSKRLIKREELQLVGVTSLLLACKFEEIFSPEVKNLCELTENAYTPSQILRMEEEILKVLEFNLLFASPSRIFDIYSKKAQFSKYSKIFGKYILELALIDYKLLPFAPSELAESALIFTRKCLKLKKSHFEKEQKLYREKCGGKNQSRIIKCTRNLAIMLVNANNNPLQTVQKKYRDAKYMSVSTFRC